MSSVPANVHQSTLDPNSTPPRLFGGVEGLREYRSMPHGQTATVVNDNVKKASLPIPATTDII